MYNKYAESARFNWLSNFATTIDPEHADEWNAFMTPKDVGLIMRSIKTDYKFVSSCPLFAFLFPFYSTLTARSPALPR